MSGMTLTPFFVSLHAASKMARVEDGAYLHLVDFRIDHAEAASAEAEHRVLLVEFAGAGDGRLYLLGLGAVRVEGLEGLRELRYLRKELM